MRDLLHIVTSSITVESSDMGKMSAYVKINIENWNKKTWKSIVHVNLHLTDGSGVKRRQTDVKGELGQAYKIPSNNFTDT